MYRSASGRVSFEDAFTRGGIQLTPTCTSRGRACRGCLVGSGRRAEPLSVLGIVPGVDSTSIPLRFHFDSTSIPVAMAAWSVTPTPRRPHPYIPAAAEGRTRRTDTLARCATARVRVCRAVCVHPHCTAACARTQGATTARDRLGRPVRRRRECGSAAPARAANRRVHPPRGRAAARCRPAHARRAPTRDGRRALALSLLSRLCAGAGGTCHRVGGRRLWARGAR